MQSFSLQLFCKGGNKMRSGLRIGTHFIASTKSLDQFAGLGSLQHHHSDRRLFTGLVNAALMLW